MARAIAEGIGPDARAMATSEAKDDALIGIGLIVAGSPIVAVSAVTGEGLKELLSVIDSHLDKTEPKKDTGRPAEVTSLPQFEDSNNPQDVASYQVMTVPKTSKNAERAWDLITYIASPQIQMKYLVKTGLPNTLKDKVKDSNNFIDIQNQYSASWYDPEPKKTGEIFRQAISAALAGQNPQTVLEGAAAQVTNLLKGLQR